MAVLLVVSLATPASAQDETRRAEARAHFERAMRAFNGGDNTLALAEFRRADELLPHPQVKFNVLLVLAAAGRSVEALDASEALLRDPTGLSPEQRRRVEAVKAEQASRIGSILVQTNVDQGIVEVDGVQAAVLPLRGPLRVAAGSRIVGVVAPGHAPLRREVLVAGGAQAQASLPLVPLQGRLAQLRVSTRTLAVDVLVDGQLIGRSPLPASLALAPGDHAVELRRKGYTTERRTVPLGEGAVGEVTFDLAEDPAGLTGQLVLALEHADAQVSVDERLRPGWAAGLRLPPGPHRVRIERGGFRPYEGQVDLPDGEPLRLTIRLEPTAETLAEQTEKARFWRKIAWGSMIGGAVIAGAGGGYALYANGKRSDAQGELDRYLASRTPENQANGGVVCVIGSTPVKDGNLCNEFDQELQGQVSSWNTKRTLGFVGLGVGAAALATGIVLYATGDDPGKPTDAPHPYGLRPSSLRFAVGPGSALLSGQF